MRRYSLTLSICSHRDDKAREQFDVHTAALKREGVQFWFDGDMIAGDELDPEIGRQLRIADIFVALASPDYLHSDYCFIKEYGFALRKASRGKVHVVVALIKQSQWRHTRMQKYKALPKDAKPVSQWARHADAYEDIMEGLREVVKTVRLSKAGTPKSRVVRSPAKAKVSAAVKLKKPTRSKPIGARKAVAAEKAAANPKVRRSKRPRSRSAP